MSLKSKLGSGDFAILAEIEPPKGVDVSKMINNAVRVKGKVDAFVVNEMSNAVMKMSSLGGAMLLNSQGMETVMQICCRDRNRLALQADILAAFACGIKNIMIITGADASFGDHHQTKAVYDLNLIELLNVVQTLCSGRDMADIELDKAPDFVVGSTVNASLQGDLLLGEIDKMNEKIEAGTEFFITPPVFSLNSIEPFMKAVDCKKIRIIPTVLLLKSAGMARYINRNLENVNISEDLIKQIQKAPDKMSASIQIAREMIGDLKKEEFCGVHISTIGWEHKLSKII